MAVVTHLYNSIIPAIALSAHTEFHAIGIQKKMVIIAGILAIAVRMMIQPPLPAFFANKQ